MCSISCPEQEGWWDPDQQEADRIAHCNPGFGDEATAESNQLRHYGLNHREDHHDQ